MTAMVSNNIIDGTLPQDIGNYLETDVESSDVNLKVPDFEANERLSRGDHEFGPHWFGMGTNHNQALPGAPACSWSIADRCAVA